MKIGFIGAGKAGCSLGKYFSSKAAQAGILVTGYYSLIEEEAKWAATFTNSELFQSMKEVVAVSDTIILSTPDGAIKNVWETMNKENIKGKVFCHLSGSLSSDVFSGIEDYSAYPISIHPMFAFSDKESVYQQINQVCFTLEGHPFAVSSWKEILDRMGNDSVVISKKVKPQYHTAASLLSNHVIAVLNVGYQLLCECGFTEEEARRFSEALVINNVEHVIKDGSISALTGPIERGDTKTVEKHLSVIDERTEELYRVCGMELLELAKQKNPNRDYEDMNRILKGEELE